MHHPRLLALVALFALFAAPAANAFFGFEPHFRHGAVYARALVTDGSGNPIYAEYDTNGQIISEIGAATGPLANATVMSGDEFRAYVSTLGDFRAANEFGIAQGAELITWTQFFQRTFYTATGQRMTKPPLRPGTRSVLVRDESQRLLPNAGQLVLLELPVNLVANPNLAADVQSVLLDGDGKIIRTSQHNIGYKVGFFGDDPNRRLGRGYFDDIHGPIPNVLLENFSTIGGKTVTGSDGRFTLAYFVSPCPGFTFTYTTDIWAELRYQNFRPRGAPTIPYYLRRPDYTFCNGLGAYNPFSYTLAGLMTQIAIIGINATSTVFTYKADFPVDVMMLTGGAEVSNLGIGGQGAVRLGQPTRYSENPQTLEFDVRNNFDFDGDGVNDRAVRGDYQTVDGVRTFVADSAGELQGIYMSSSDHDPASDDPELQVPDLARLLDADAVYEPQGLLESLSFDDLADTDIYVFRRSNGRLIMEREGLGAQEVGSYASSGVNQDAEQFVYRLLIRGPGDGLSFVSARDRDFADWQSRAGMAPELHSRASDHIRAGEEVEIVAINRVTGYIGTTTTTMRSADQNAGQLSFPISAIRMGPPNLKIWARRAYNVEFGGTRGERETYRIGYEGSALTTDSYVEIRTEWFDHDGTALPEGLGDFGFTGRLSRVSGPGTLAPVAGAVANFSIRPGIQLQIVQLPDRVQNRQHFYVHVSGSPDYETPDFGANPGALAFRPNHYVPVKVEIPDEAATIEQDKAWRALRRTSPSAGAIEPGGVYREAYRPEFQFSTFDLEVQAIRRRLDDDTTIDIRDADNPTLSEFDVGLELLYSLTAPAAEALPQLGEERRLAFALGADEIEATLLPNRTILFENLDHLDLLEVGDHLTLRLAATNDSSNVLWQFAFAKIGLVTDMNRDGIISDAARDAEADPEDPTKRGDRENYVDQPFRFWVNDDNDTGDIVEGDGDIPDFLPFNEQDRSNDVVDGLRDMVDFFPVYVDAKAMLDSYPPTSHDYVLAQADDAFKFFEATDFEREGFNDLELPDSLVREWAAAYGQRETPVRQITASGVTLSVPFLRRLRDTDEGLLFLEATAVTQQPLVLSVRERASGEILARANLYVSISPVEEMYRHLDLQDVPTNRENDFTPGRPNDPFEPENLPDRDTVAKYFVMVHGYNVSGTASRGWGSTVFKRLYRLGSHARFIAVTWDGDAQLAVSGPPPDYHHAVFNALSTGKVLDSALAEAMPEPGEVTVAAHSLGNGVVGAAISEGGFDPDNYLMIDPAVAIEAYDPSQATGPDYAAGGVRVNMESYMTEFTWLAYPPKTRSTYWHTLFHTADVRSRMTWRGRFAEVLDNDAPSGKTRVYNFYSSEEEVLENPPEAQTITGQLWNTISQALGSLSGGPLSSRAWIFQEVAKGCKNLLSPLLFAGHCSGGWAYNEDSRDLEYVGEYSILELDHVVRDGGSAWNAVLNGDLTDEELAQIGLFSRFKHYSNAGIFFWDNLFNPTRYREVYAPTTPGGDNLGETFWGSGYNTGTYAEAQALVGLDDTQWDMLASALPALSFAAGSNPIDHLNLIGHGQNVNMATLKAVPTVWPDRSGSGYGRRWLHSDIRDVAVQHTINVYDRMMTIGRLNEAP